MLISYGQGSPRHLILESREGNCVDEMCSCHVSLDNSSIHTMVLVHYGLDMFLVVIKRTKTQVSKHFTVTKGKNSLTPAANAKKRR